MNHINQTPTALYVPSRYHQNSVYPKQSFTSHFQGSSIWPAYPGQVQPVAYEGSNALPLVGVSAKRSSFGLPLGPDTWNNHNHDLHKQCNKRPPDTVRSWAKSGHHSISRKSASSQNRQRDRFLGKFVVEDDRAEVSITFKADGDVKLYRDDKNQLKGPAGAKMDGYHGTWELADDGKADIVIDRVNGKLKEEDATRLHKYYQPFRVESKYMGRSVDLQGIDHDGFPLLMTGLMKVGSASVEESKYMGASSFISDRRPLQGGTCLERKWGSE